jgi:uncharacterized protein DUF6228
MVGNSSLDAVVFDSRTRVRLELLPARRPHDFGRGELPTWQARLLGDGLDGSVVCPEAAWEPRLLADVLESISEDWRGWEGERMWQSEEAEVRLTFRHDKGIRSSWRLSSKAGLRPAGAARPN